MLGPARRKTTTRSLRGLDCCGSWKCQSSLGLWRTLQLKTPRQQWYWQAFWTRVGCSAPAASAPPLPSSGGGWSHEPRLGTVTPPRDHHEKCCTGSWRTGWTESAMEMWGEKKKVKWVNLLWKRWSHTDTKKHGLNYLINSGQVFDGFLFL